MKQLNLIDELIVDNFAGGGGASGGTGRTARPPGKGAGSGAEMSLPEEI